MTIMDFFLYWKRDSLLARLRNNCNFCWVLINIAYLFIESMISAEPEDLSNVVMSTNTGSSFFCTKVASGSSGCTRALPVLSITKPKEEFPSAKYSTSFRSSLSFTSVHATPCNPEEMITEIHIDVIKPEINKAFSTFTSYTMRCHLVIYKYNIIQQNKKDR